jgi:hypothetical protein
MVRGQEHSNHLSPFSIPGVLGVFPALHLCRLMNIRFS